MTHIFLVAVVLAVVVFGQGCTVHFKGENVEFDAERQRVEHNATFELESIGLFDG